MRAWESDNERGVTGPWVGEGDLAVVIQAWVVGNRQVRLRLIVNDLISVFSCELHNLAVNWQPVGTGVTSSLGP